ncbi:MAG TPA: hypothetical protein VJ962_11710 [Clostridia bacterium]|nr:hypothetical protein [Clostridia bacterium]
MYDFKKTVPYKNEGTYSYYDGGSEDTTTSYLVADVSLDNKVAQLLVYPTTDSSIKLNGSDKEIYLPANSWTPISVGTESFNVKALEEAGIVYWQGWYL